MTTAIETPVHGSHSVEEGSPVSPAFSYQLQPETAAGKRLVAIAERAGRDSRPAPVARS
jgi:hypothetical protein